MLDLQVPWEFCKSSVNWTLCVSEGECGLANGDDGGHVPLVHAAITRPIDNILSLRSQVYKLMFLT